MERQLDNWLERYIEFTQNSEPPLLYHLWTGIVAISSCMQRKCYINWGHEQVIYPNMYVVLVGPPGGRKGTAMKIGKSLVQSVDVPLSSDSLGSVQALYNEIKLTEQIYIDPKDSLEYKHKSLSVWSEEFQVFLSSSDPRFIINVTDLFDCPKIWRYASIGRGHEDLSNCFLTIFGATTPSSLQSNLTQDAVGGGLISRIIFVVGYGKAKKVPITLLSKEEEDLRNDLYTDLELIKNISGEYTATQQFLSMYSDWYMSKDSTAGVDDNKFVGYNDRRALHLRKLCLICAASESNERVLHIRHFERALHILQMTEQEMPNAFHGIGTAQHSQVFVNIMQFLKSTGTIEWAKLLKRFQLDVDAYYLERIIDSLVQSKDVKIEFDTKKRRHITFTANDNKSDINFIDHELFRHVRR